MISFPSFPRTTSQLNLASHPTSSATKTFVLPELPETESHSIRIQLLVMPIAALLMLLLCVSNGKAQIPDDVIALASVASDNYYYQSNVPYHRHMAKNLENHVDEIRLSGDSNLAQAANELGAARKALFQIDAASFAINSGTQIRAAIQELETIWEDQPETQDSFGIDSYRGNTNRIRPGYNRIQTDELRESPQEFIRNIWGVHGLELLGDADLEPAEFSLNFQFGLLREVGYGVLRNTGDEALRNVIAVFKYEADHEDQQNSGEVIYFFPELAPKKSVAILSLAQNDWRLSTTEDNPRKFNMPLKKGHIKVTMDIYCDQGKQRDLPIDIRDGMRVQMDCVRTILTPNSLFRASHGATMTVSKSTGRGRTLSLTFADGGKATLNNSWDAEKRDKDFIPGSSAFTIRIEPSEDDESDDPRANDPRQDIPRKRGAGGRDRTGGEVVYTWRDGALVSGSTTSPGDVLYPTDSASEN